MSESNDILKSLALYSEIFKVIATGRKTMNPKIAGNVAELLARAYQEISAK